MYINYKKWIQKEIDGSKKYRKPILAVNPFGKQKKLGIMARQQNLWVKSGSGRSPSE